MSKGENLFLHWLENTEHLYLIFFSNVRKGRKSSDMSSGLFSRLRGPSGYTTSPLTKHEQNRAEIRNTISLNQKYRDYSFQLFIRKDFTYHTIASRGIVNMRAGS